ncbi:MAG: asparaginase [Myxococcales bacterium FL481]|nr:MAG: asparaginase [Myxococcales bacterium FL481]
MPPAAVKVCVIHVGGTIGMTLTESGHFAPQPGFLGEYLRGLTELRSPELPEFEFVELPPLLDSADLGPQDWLRIAEAIIERYDEYAGFVVVHGTDTMAYSASALSFLLDGLSKPVVLTGAQLSVVHPRSDGREHLLTSLIVAGSLDIPEVSICFGRRVLRGNRAQKVHNQDFVAFDSGNLEPLASVGARIVQNRRTIRPPGSGRLRPINLPRDPKVVSLRLFPGLGAELLEHLLEPTPDGLVLETYGVGNAPVRDGAFLAVLERAIFERQLVVVNCSQCHGGFVQPETYATGAALARVGVRSGADMTPEAALTKLYCLLAKYDDIEHVSRLVGEDLAGELTIS